MTALVEPLAQGAQAAKGYFAVRVELLRHLHHPVVPLFAQYKPNTEPVLYHRDGAPLGPAQFARLTSVARGKIFVRDEDFRQFGANLLESVDSLAEQKAIPATERFAVLQIAMAAEIEHSAQRVDCGAFVEVAEKLGAEIGSLMKQNEVWPGDLFRLARHDFNTFTHVTNVAGYAVILARQLGWCDETALDQIATAAILHDIGKRFIPASILTKPSKLTPEERAIVEEHPQRGYEELHQRPEMTFDQLMIVYSHHERFDGTGYPVGLRGNEIHPWARMIAVVDMFDAATGMRPYRRPATTQEALDYLGRSAGSHFDPEIVACWNAIMAKK